MAFGISPRYSETQTFENSLPTEILLLALEALKAQGWEVGFISSSRLVAYSSMSMNSWSEKITVTLNNRELTIQSECTSNQVLDWGKNKKNTAAFFKSFYEIRATLSVEDIQEKLKTVEFSKSEDGSPAEESFETGHDKIKNVWSIFIPTKGYFVTPILLNLNLLIFILMITTGVNIFQPDSDSLLVWGANFRPLTLTGQAWRLLTSCFLHIGILHLIFNMYALVYIGLLLELRLGRARFLAAYILSGIAGSIASVYWNELIISAGASGAIFGMYGVFLALLTTNLIEKTARKNFLASIVVFVGYNLVAGLRGEIDNAAHIGGLISGMAIGYVFYFSLLRPNLNSWKYGSIAAITILILIVSVILYKKIPNDLPEYDRKMEEFAVIEERALEPLRMDDSTPDSLVYEKIKNIGIPSWNEAMNVIRAADKLDIPEPLRVRNEKLINYCHLRINVYKLVLKSMEENTQSYNSRIIDYNMQINQLVEELMAEAGVESTQD
jgi:rhomboid protease GluP